jgi:hypothetical protein
MQNRKSRTQNIVNHVSTLSGLLSNVAGGLFKLMKNPIGALVILSTYQALLVSGQAPASTIVGNYTFDNGNALDSSGYGNHGAIFGGVPIEDRFGRPKSALYFNSLTYVWGKADEFPTDERTVAFWFKPDIWEFQPGRDRGCMMVGYGGGDTCGTSFLMNLNNPGNPANNSYEIQSHCDINYVFYSDPAMTGSPSTWQYWVVTTEYGVGTKIYIDGKLVKTDSSLFITKTSVEGKKFFIGQGVDPSGMFPFGGGITPGFKGGIDDMIFASVAWPASKVLEQYKLTAPTIPSVTPENPPSNEPILDKPLQGVVGGIGSLLLSFAVGAALYSPGKKLTHNCLRFFRPNQPDALDDYHAVDDQGPDQAQGQEQSQPVEVAAPPNARPDQAQGQTQLGAAPTAASQIGGWTVEASTPFSPPASGRSINEEEKAIPPNSGRRRQKPTPVITSSTSATNEVQVEVRRSLSPR